MYMGTLMIAHRAKAYILNDAVLPSLLAQRPLVRSNRCNFQPRRTPFVVVLNRTRSV